MMLIAKKSMIYAGRSLEPGDEFEAGSESDARILKAIGKAEDAPADAVIDEPAAEQEAKPARKTGHYKRRDMKAED